MNKVEMATVMRALESVRGGPVLTSNQCHDLAMAINAQLADPAAQAVDEEQERAKFENEFRDLNLERNPQHPDVYLHLPTRQMWDAWFARAALAAPVQSEQEPVAIVADGDPDCEGTEFLMLVKGAVMPPVGTKLYAAPVRAVSMPEFTGTVIAKLERFMECTEDGQDSDIGREWFDVLTTLGLLKRAQRSPALWEITDAGKKAVARLNT